MNKNIAIPFLALIVGFGLGYLVFSSDNSETSIHEGHMSQMMTEMNMSLEGKTGDAFDRAFLEEMIVHHEGAVDMAQQVLEVSERDELRNLATAIIDAQTTEIDMMKNWIVEWF